MAGPRWAAGGGRPGQIVRGAAGARRPPLSWWIREGLSFLVSLGLHLGLLLALGLWVTPPELLNPLTQLLIVPTAREQERLEAMPADIPEPQLDTDEATRQLLVANQASEPRDLLLADDLETAAPQVQWSDIGELTAPRSELLATVGGLQGNALEGRGAGARAALARSGGGTPGSEQAVARALQWLKDHQNSNGSWCLDHRLGRCQGRCPDPGLAAPSLNAATALALLPFLGAGQTHMEGEYQKTVGAGIYFLVRSMQVVGQQGSLYEPHGTMYSHGLASIALCEAYAMTEDRALAAPAQMALNFIVSAQDPVGGGWRYEPRTPGDTSVLGWQLMALKSGHMAYLDVPSRTIQKSARFLDSVQEKGGAFYGYLEPGRKPRFGTTAVGLLCRMYLGWKQDHEALQRGVEWITKHGPATNDFYGNYYAMQLMFQYTGGEGPVWEKWNTALREELVRTQAQDSHTAGSWYVPGGQGNEAGGRLYCTAMATMMLEVYYRHLPIYGKQATEDEFPL
ncbi:MAG: hypothetical protein A2W31_18860 [Planctomycetes bacterium RBG_16_64_10]|nr:MAG: hypothetical protein A2W31_18860 [Planctomycetes bacterium RBG_16_64_10]